MPAKTNQPIRKFLYGVALAGLILSLCLGSSGAPVARAHAAWTDTPAGATGVPTEPPVATPPPTQPASTQTIDPALFIYV